MSNICDTQYKVRGSRKALSDLWNTLQMMDVNSKDVYLYKLAEHYGIDYEHSGISVHGKIYWAEFEDDEDGGLLSFDTESAWSACDMFFDELNKVLGDVLDSMIGIICLRLRRHSVFLFGQRIALDAMVF